MLDDSKTGGRTPRLSFALKDIMYDQEREPLHVVFARALKTINRIGARPGEAEDTGPLACTPFAKPNWLAKIAIRAVCEAINAKGLMPLPLAVDMHWKDETSDALPCVIIPEAFRNLAKKHGVQARFLAEVALNEYVARNPDGFTFRTGYPLDPGEVLEDDGDHQQPPQDGGRRSF